MLRYLHTFSFLITLLILQGCVTAPTSVNPASTNQAVNIDNALWWYARFKIAWPENTDPDFSIDPLIADRIVEPVLISERQHIRYWRFHRRAVRDIGGHQFSFIFYTDKQTATRIYQKLQTNPYTAKLKSANILESLITDDPAKNDRSSVAATSDPSWSKEMQAAWPDYIMGVSQLWLNLIDSFAGNSSNQDLDTLLAEYRQINSKITDSWQSEGEHALLHHLNAVFGYAPMPLNIPARF